jgi:hypothetical protein
MEENQKTSDQELNKCFSQVYELDKDRLLSILGIQKQSQTYVFHFFNRKIIFDQNDFFDPDGQEINSSIKTLLCRYMIHCPEFVVVETNRLISFREFPGTGPLFSRFTENTNKIVEHTFSGQSERLEKRCLKFGGVQAKANGYDLSFRFMALPKIPVFFHFNDKDDILPAQSVFLFRDNADNYLDIKSLGTIITYLVGLLIQ